MEPFRTGSSLAIEYDRTSSFEHVIEFGGSLVKVWLGSIDINGVCPCNWFRIGVFAADQSIAKPALALFSRRFPFVSNEQRSGRWWLFTSITHPDSSLA